MLHIQAQLRNPLHHQQQILLLEKMRSSYQKNMRFLSLRKFQKGRKSQPLVTHHPGTQLKKSRATKQRFPLENHKNDGAKQDASKIEASKQPTTPSSASSHEGRRGQLFGH